MNESKIKILITSIFLIIALLIIILYIWPFFKIVISIFQDYLSNRILLEYLGFLYVSAFFSGLLTLIIYGILFAYGKRFNGWTSSMIFFIFFFLISGLFYIQSELGLTKEIGLILWDDDTPEKFKFGEIHCTDGDKQLFVDDTAICNVTPELYNITGKIELYSGSNLSSTTQITSRNMDFQALDEITHISVKIQGYDTNGRYRHLSTGWPHTFLTDAIVEKSKEKFKQYLFPLFSLVFILVPTAIASIRAICKKED